MTTRTTQLNHKRIYDLYNEYLKQFSEEVPSQWRATIDKKMLCARVSEDTGYDEGYICRIVNRELKKNECRADSFQK